MLRRLSATSLVAIVSLAVAVSGGAARGSHTSATALTSGQIPNLCSLLPQSLIDSELDGDYVLQPGRAYMPTKLVTAVGAADAFHTFDHSYILTERANCAYVDKSKDVMNQGFSWQLSAYSRAVGGRDFVALEHAQGRTNLPSIHGVGDWAYFQPDQPEIDFAIGDYVVALSSDVALGPAGASLRSAYTRLARVLAGRLPKAK
jgi:hypothetical protein